MHQKLKKSNENNDNQASPNPKPNTAIAIHGCATSAAESHIAHCPTHSSTITPPYLNTSEGSPLSRSSASAQGDPFQQNQRVSECMFRMCDTDGRNQPFAPLDTFVSRYRLKHIHLANAFDADTPACKQQRKVKSYEQGTPALAIVSVVEGPSNHPSKPNVASDKMKRSMMWVKGRLHHLRTRLRKVTQ